MESHIIDNLYIGSMQDAENWARRLVRDEVTILLVTENTFRDDKMEDIIQKHVYNYNTLWMPFIRHDREGSEYADVADLNLTAGAINQRMWNKCSVLVYCGLGISRAPLAVAWYLRKYREFSLDSAYTLIKAARPMIEDKRLDWGID